MSLICASLLILALRSAPEDQVGGPGAISAEAELMTLAAAERELWSWAKENDPDRLEAAIEILLPIQDRPAAAYLGAWAADNLGDVSRRNHFLEAAHVEPTSYFWLRSTVELEQLLAWSLADLCTRQLGEVVRRLEAWQSTHGGQLPPTLQALESTHAGLPLCPATHRSLAHMGYDPSAPSAGASLAMAEHFHQHHAQGVDPARPESGPPPEFNTFRLLLTGNLDVRRLSGLMAPLIEAGGLKSGMVVADIGAGPGLFALPLARQLSPDGMLVAVDLDLYALDLLAHRAREAGITNIHARLCEEDDVGLPPESIDVVYVINTLHVLVDRANVRASDVAEVERSWKDPPQLREVLPDARQVVDWLTSVQEALKPGGRLIVLDDRLDTALMMALAHAASLKYEGQAELERRMILWQFTVE